MQIIVDLIASGNYHALKYVFVTLDFFPLLNYPLVDVLKGSVPCNSLRHVY